MPRSSPFRRVIARLHPQSSALRRTCEMDDAPACRRSIAMIRSTNEASLWRATRWRRRFPSLDAAKQAKPGDTAVGVDVETHVSRRVGIELVPLVAHVRLERRFRQQLLPL